MPVFLFLLVFSLPLGLALSTLEIGILIGSANYYPDLWTDIFLCQILIPHPKYIGRSESHVSFMLISQKDLWKWMFFLFLLEWTLLWLTYLVQWSLTSSIWTLTSMYRIAMQNNPTIKWKASKVNALICLSYRLSSCNLNY